MDLAIIPECYVDTNLVETLVPPAGKGYNHQHGCGTVTKVMKERFADRFALGIIDKDKKEVDYLQECNVVLTSGSLLLHKHKIKHHYVIQISPAIERMIFTNAAAAGITVTDYGLPADMASFQKLAKTRTSKNDDRFKRLFRALRVAGAADFEKLAAWIAYLRDRNYAADVEELKKL
ncbi:MAG: hypothetical protein EOO10_11465 [Chitinophagaceae bacterium]|nr:MAG: hypothetical protein EOO10_11465 [Chitinophagaceae bacterium]